MKKAQLDIVWFWRITITFMIVLFIYFISIDYLNAKINTGDLEEQGKILSRNNRYTKIK